MSGITANEKLKQHIILVEKVSEYINPETYGLPRWVFDAVCTPHMESERNPDDLKRIKSVFEKTHLSDYLSDDLDYNQFVDEFI